MSFVVDESLPTPRLQFSDTIVRRNIRRMADYAAENGLNLRPHTKTHKSLYVSKLQLDDGACGLTVAKVGEAEVLSQVCDDLLIAYPTVDVYRCRRVAELATRVQLSVALDSQLAAENLSREVDRRGVTVGLLVDVDLGYGRTGAQTDAQAISLAQRIDRLPGLRLDGIMTYTGHVTGSGADQAVAFREIDSRLEQLLEAWKQTGLCGNVVSSGSTPAAFHCHLARCFTEIRPGTYVFNDMNIVRGGYASLTDCAARVVTTVVSDSVRDQVVLDAGSKTLTSDLCGPDPDSGYGFIEKYPEAKVCRLTEEHAQVDVSLCADRPRLGEQLTIVPNHICVCVNMQSEVWWQDGSEVPIPRKVDTRGRLI